MAFRGLEVKRHDDGSVTLSSIHNEIRMRLEDPIFDEDGHLVVKLFKQYISGGRSSSWIQYDRHESDLIWVSSDLVHETQGDFK